MRRIVVAALVLTVFAPFLWSASLDLKPIGDDFSIFFGELGKEILPHAQQNALMGAGIGDAEIGNFPHMHFALTTSAVVSDGIAKFVGQTPSPFQLLNVNDLVTTALGSNADAQKYFDLAQTIFPYPSLQVSLGFGIVAGFEGMLQFTMFPQALTDAVVGLAGMPADAISLNALNVGGRIRKVLMSDAGPFPAISVGIGYIYTNFQVGYDLGKIDPIPFTGGNLSLEGTMGIGTTLQTAGVDFMVSKKLLFFVPFFKTSAWYQAATYKGSIEGFDAILNDSGGNPVASYSGSGGTSDPSATLSINDLSVLFSGGFALALGPIGLTLEGSYNIATATPAASIAIGVRF